jgi:hypothetical protein
LDPISSGDPTYYLPRGIIHDRLANPTGSPRFLVAGESAIREEFAARSEKVRD